MQGFVKSRKRRLVQAVAIATAASALGAAPAQAAPDEGGAAPSSPAVQVSSGGFDWTDAGIGIACTHPGEGAVHPGELAGVVSRALADGRVGRARRRVEPSMQPGRGQDPRDAVCHRGGLLVGLQLSQVTVIERSCRGSQTLHEAARQDRAVPGQLLGTQILEGGFGSSVVDAAADAGLDVRLIRRLGLPQRWIPTGSRGDQKVQAGIDPSSIAAAVRAAVESAHARLL